MPDVKTQIKSVMDKYGIPEKIWLPIAVAESSLNKDSTAITPTEFSKGIFQINVKAHPQYSYYDLYDPTVNAEIAAKDFILPAYNYAKSVTSDEKKQALIIYSGLKDPDNIKAGYIPEGGIRPLWTPSKKEWFSNLFDTSSTFTPTTAVNNTTPISNNLTSIDDLDTFQQVVKFLIIIGLILVSIFAVFKLLGQDIPIGNIATMIAKKGG